VVHLVDDQGALLIDFNYGSGRVAILTDPYIVSNGGIRLNDNLQLAINLLTAGDGSLLSTNITRARDARKTVSRVTLRVRQCFWLLHKPVSRAFDSLDQGTPVWQTVAAGASRSTFESRVRCVDG
jgi:hypothetical protein